MVAPVLDCEQETKRMYVFVSQSRQNSSIALALCQELQKHGVETWMDIRDLPLGADWTRAVNRAIRDAAGIVFLIGPPGSSDQGQMHQWEPIIEEEMYLDRTKPMVPVVIGGAELPGFLRTRRPFELDDPARDVAALADVIKAAIASPEATVNEEEERQVEENRKKAIEKLRALAKGMQESEAENPGLVR